MDLGMIPQVNESSIIWMIHLQEVWKNENKDGPDIEDIWMCATNRHEK